MGWLFDRRIKAKRFFNYDKKRLNVKGIKAVIPSDKLPLDFSIGDISLENFPTEVSDKLKEIDLLQVSLKDALNSMNEGEIKESKKNEFFDTLILMIKIAQNPSKMEEIYKKKESDKDLSDLYDFYNNSDYQIANITKHELTTPGLIIWPVALQARPTIIHKAQIEIIRILQKSKWDLKIIIADCGTDNISDKKITLFKTELEKHLKKREIIYDTIELLSESYKPDTNGGNILTKFTEISSKLKISELKEYNTKQDSYSDENKQKVENRSTLKFIQPVLTWSVVIHEADNYSEVNQGKKTIIIAGKDELNQWKYIFSFSSNIGGIFNIILKDEGKNTIFQEEKPMIFHSEMDVIDNLDKGNLAKWLFEAFVSTPSFPDKLINLQFCKECKRIPDCRECLFPDNSDGKLPEFVDRRKFVSSFWGIINPE